MVVLTSKPVDIVVVEESWKWEYLHLPGIYTVWHQGVNPRGKAYRPSPLAHADAVKFITGASWEGV